MHEPRTLSRSWTMALLLPLLSGCTLSPLSQRATTFSTAASATVLQVKNGYPVVEQSYADAQTARLVATFDKQGFNASQIQPFIPPKDMQVRLDLLAGLEQYATLLAEVSGNEPITAVDTQSQALGTHLESVATEANLARFTKTASIDAGAAAAAVDALGRALVERKRARELPAILEKMQKPIDTICELIEEDIGDPEKGGLRNQLKNDYDELVHNQVNFILQNEATMSAEDKRTEIAKLPALVSDARRADTALAETKDALRQLAAAHDALVDTRSSRDAPAFQSLVGQLVAQSQQLGSVYAAVTAKK